MELHSPSSSPAHTSFKLSSGRSVVEIEPWPGSGRCSTKFTLQSGQRVNRERYSALHFGTNHKGVEFTTELKKRNRRPMLDAISRKASFSTPHLAGNLRR